MRGIVDQMQADVAWLDERDIVLRDIATGLLDFPALVCGPPGLAVLAAAARTTIEFWHRIEEGFAGRRPLRALPDEAARA